MKTNVSIELDPGQLDAIATMIDNKITKRLATRADINELVRKFIGGITSQSEWVSGKVTKDTDKMVTGIVNKDVPRSDLYRIRPGEEKFLKGKSESYCYGWNKARSDGK
jgi:hypothetical protein